MTGFFKNPFEKTRPVPDPDPRDGTGHGIVPSLLGTLLRTSLIGQINHRSLNRLIQALMGSTTANGFQLVVGSSPPKPLPDFAMTNLQGLFTKFKIVVKGF